MSFLGQPCLFTDHLWLLFLYETIWRMYSPQILKYSVMTLYRKCAVKINCPSRCSCQKVEFNGWSKYEEGSDWNLFDIFPLWACVWCVQVWVDLGVYHCSLHSMEAGCPTRLFGWSPISASCMQELQRWASVYSGMSSCWAGLSSPSLFSVLLGINICILPCL